MIVELVLKDQPKLELEGYEKIGFSTGAVFSSPVEKRVEIVVKKHSDGRVSIFTDNSDVVKSVVKSTEVIDLHAK